MEGPSKFTIFIYCLPAVVWFVYFYGFEAYTFGWHLFSKNPIIFKDFIIKVPKEAIAQIEDFGPHKSNLAIRNIVGGGIPVVSFSEYNPKVKFSDSLMKNFDSNNFITLGKPECKILNQKCYWRRLLRRDPSGLDLSQSPYTEMISINIRSTNYAIGYAGKIYNRSMLLEIVKDLKLAPKASNQ